MILLRMIPWSADFEHLQGRVMFGMNSLVLTWEKEMPMPNGLVDGVMAALEEGGQSAPAIEPEPALERV